MNSRHIVRTLILACAVLFPAASLHAQEAEPATVDTLRVPAAYEGTLFGTSRVTNTAAVSAVGGKALDKTVSADLPNTLPGQIPGFGVKMGNGEPGNSNAEWLIRGIGSYTYGRQNECKVFIDGFESNYEYLAYMLPAEIESISILKDAAALSPFGMTGSNGVIWVTTKRGSIGAPRVKVLVRTSLQDAININKPLDAYDYASLYNQAYSNDNGGQVWNQYYSNQVLNGYLYGTPGYNSANTPQPNIDWYDQILRKSANYTDVVASVDGGGNTARYNIVMGYSNQQGLLDVKNSDQTSNVNMGRFNLRANLDMEFFDIFEVKVDIGGRLEERKRPNYDIGTLFNDVAGLPSNAYWVFDDPEGTRYSGTSIYANNPRASIRSLGWFSSRTRITQANFSIRERLDFITPGLYLEESFSFYSRSRSTYSKTRNYARYSEGATTTTDQDTPLTASGYGSDGMLDWKQLKVTLGYNNSVGLHNVSAAGAFHLSDRKNDGIYQYKIHYMNFYGRVNYNYDSRYTAEVGFSAFGTDAYAKSNRWGFYPSISAGWVLSNEDFLASASAVDFLKLRASVGLTGSNEAGSDVNVNGFDTYGRYLYQQYYYWNSGFNTGNSLPYENNGSIAPRFIANKDLKAEKSLKYNVGLDATLWGGLDLSADVFLDKRRDIITIDNSFMGYFGNVYYLDNIGKMTNKGFEVSAAYNGTSGEFGYSVWGMASMAVNKIDYMAETSTAFPYNSRTGRAYGAIYGLVADGFYTENDFENGELKPGIAKPTFGSVQPGDIKYRDLDDDGLVDETDVRKIGNPYYPKLNYSFGFSATWRGLDVGIMFRGASGGSVNLMDFPAQFVAFVDNNNAYKIAQGAWAYLKNTDGSVIVDTRDTATYPRLTTENNENNYRNSTFWVRKNNFLRIQNVEIGYDFAGRVLRSANVSSLRLFGNITNPVTWSKLLKDYDMDPETYFGYPNIRSFTIGLSVQF